MIEKRFMLDDTGELIDLNNHQFINYGEECCNLLNELNDENMMLKSKNAEYELLLMSLEETARKFCEIPKVK